MSVVAAGKGSMNASAIVLAAGAGTRMKSKQPKVLHDILGKPLIRWVVDAALDAGVQNIVTVLGFGREAVEPLVLPDSAVVIQPRQKGTADAVASCRDACAGIRGSLLVLSGDCPLITPAALVSLAAAREEYDAGVAVLTMEVADPCGYGRIVRDAAGSVEAIVEQKDCSVDQAAISECNSGFYCFDADLLFSVLCAVSDDNAQGEFYLTDVIEIAREKGRAVVGLRAEDPSECMGINTRVQLAEATRIMQQRINRRHMLAGVGMVDPSTVWIGPDVRISSDVQILPMTMLSGMTEIGEDSIIGPNTRLTDTVVGRGCLIDETVAVEARIDDECTCGPRAYLRPGAHLCAGAKAGTHVEIKKSTIGPGSKVPHLSYIGDATLGSNVNIGAGSITCNYDGLNKWPTVIGDNAFIGSDTMMVAPVSIGADTVIGAGSVITDDVPARALALGRARQVVKPQWHEADSAEE